MSARGGVRSILTTAAASWSLIVDPTGRCGRDNMQIDAALLRAATDGGAFLRLYRWSPPCLSFGRNEPATARYDVDRVRARGIDTVRRPTGGRAVWHDAEVTYAVAAPVILFGALRSTYRAVHTVVAAGLRHLGVDAQLADTPGPAPRPGAGACFAAPVGGEVTVAGRKLVGSAQIREGDAFLQHGSILLENQQHVVADLTRGGATAPPAAALNEVLGRAVTFDEVAAAIVTGARAAWGDPAETGSVPEPAGDERYGDPAWTWRR